MVESLDQEGRGVAHREGKAVFIEGALPGERVVYERRKNKPSYETGRVVRIDRASALRVTPRCPHAGLHEGACGGCSMQHVSAQAQVAIKQRVLEDTLWHIGRVRPERMLRPVAGPAWRYRFRARFSVRDVQKKGGVLVGFHERASSYVADMRQCEVVPEHVSALLVPLRELVGSLTLRERLPQIELAVAEGRPRRTRCWCSACSPTRRRRTGRACARSGRVTASTCGCSRKGRTRRPRWTRTCGLTWTSRCPSSACGSRSDRPTSPR